MPARVLTLVQPDLAARFRAASGREPLSALPPGAAAELAALLSGTPEFEDLPGKWQAALLAAEAGRADRPAAPGMGRSCCG